MKISSFICGVLIILTFASGFAIADRLPLQTPENQLFSIDTVLDSTGIVDDSSSQQWVISYSNTTEESNSVLSYHNVIADTKFKDSTLTNGGKMGVNKNFGFDSRNQGSGSSNVELEKVLTYASTEGAHMVGEEEYTLSVAGNFYAETEQIRCVFSERRRVGYPAFCNIVSAKNNLININSAQISTKGEIRAVGALTVPAELNYQIAVTPDANSGSGFAEGTVSTTFAGSIMEARDWAGYITVQNWNKTAATNTWKDHSEVTGGIKNFQKALGYKSGFVL
ncbi:MAG: hypothetical protein CVV33_09130 [Methanomicrobiales archaeon HGW-Methanomicrobiales-4]|nr:MAG: hypothetical protein CVV33_09130 [Methanomicrobiales archaeon HGW-Methanomicrobiales-4]